MRNLEDVLVSAAEDAFSSIHSPSSDSSLGSLSAFNAVASSSLAASSNWNGSGTCKPQTHGRLQQTALKAYVHQKRTDDRVCRFSFCAACVCEWRVRWSPQSLQYGFTV